MKLRESNLTPVSSRATFMHSTSILDLRTGVLELNARKLVLPGAIFTHAYFL